MSMSADDWAASRSTADVGRLSRPLLDYFASSSSSGAQLWSSLLTQARDAVVSGRSLFFCTLSLASYSPSLSAAIPLTRWSLHFPFFPFLLGWLPLATPPWHKIAKTGGWGLCFSFSLPLLPVSLLPHTLTLVLLICECAVFPANCITLSVKLLHLHVCKRWIWEQTLLWILPLIGLLQRFNAVIDRKHNESLWYSTEK